ncbi:E3 SUMO-protein ligase ZBED1-like [Metopolophium dirhodum]|uniref:E3 SUMO-protein ligase ZBED1-like n=1 Tax=Metopolophium dirhodum TaxID=44670 RepID=UPI00298F4AD8|nr:E3 SUMO-protein ligase ZBED1-like [Metopolophium dirhodum]
MSSTSNMCNYFVKVDKPHKGGCCKLFNVVVRTSGNTTNLKQHIKRKHPSLNTSKNAKCSKSNTIVYTSVEDDEADSLFVQSVSGAQTTLDTVVSQSRPESSCSLHSDYDSLISKTSDTLSVVSNLTTASRSSTSTSLKLIQPTIYQSISEFRSYESGGTKNVTITNALIYMLAKDNMPLSSTEKDGFNYFIKKALPLYKAPSRKTITKLISSKYDVLSGQIKNKLSLVESITLTTDLWTDTINTKSYLGITVHFLSLCKLNLESVVLGVLELDERHTSENIAKWLDSALQEWGIEKRQIFLVVTENGANIKNAVSVCFDKDKHLPCFAHTINLVVQNALDNTDNIATLINKQSVSTRWNSVYYMLDRFINCSDHVASIIVKFPKGPTMITGSELFIAKEIMHLLKPFEAATKELCAQKYITGSKTIPLMHCLIKKIESVEVNGVVASALKSNLSNNLQTRFGRVEHVEILSIATILDPRFKTLHSNSAVASSKSINAIKKKILELRTDSSETSSHNESSSEDDPDSLWAVHKQLVSKKALTEPSLNVNEMPTDLKHYLNQPTVPLTDNVLSFWDIHGPIYPHLKKIVDPYLGMVATSVPSERLFS